MRELVRLRHRLILILMCSVGLVLTVALIVFVASNFSAQYSRIQNSLTAALSIEGGDELRPLIGGFGEQGFAGAEPERDPGSNSAAIPLNELSNMVPVFVVDVEQTTGVITYYGSAADMDKETLLKALTSIKQEDSSGLFLDLGLFYSQQATPESALRIAFADASHLYDTTLNQALIALLIWILAMVIFFVLSLVLSRMMLRPVEEAWDKQRQFIADASHELKTPLTIILANNNIIQSHPEKTTAEQERWLESTAEEANRMNDMVTDLLLLAQVENTKDISGSSPTNEDDVVVVTRGAAEANANADTDTPFASLDLSALVERSLLQFDAVFFERGITTEAEIAKDLQIKGNSEHLRRLIDILLDNASKYGTKGGSVHVHLSRSTDRAHSALLSVANSSPLIPSEKIGQVFERFYRGDPAHSDATPGSGLGLALAQEIVREHGGTITVKSAAIDDAGSDRLTSNEQPAETTFSVVLPLT